MRINANDEIWANVDDAWTSRVISSALLDAARGDRSLWSDMGPKISGFDSNALVGARAWAAAERVAMFHMGSGSLGLPANLISQVSQSLGPLALQPPESIDALADALTTTAIGITVEALASIPVVGPIARAIGSMALMLRDLARRQQNEARDYLPPPQVYSRDAEEVVMNTQLLPALLTSDWTRLFTPRTGQNRYVMETESGWIFDSRDGGSGLGYIPGTQQISSATQAFWHRKSSRAGGSQATHQDVGDFYPGPAQLMTAIDQQVQRPGPALWSVVPSEIRDAWREHRDATMSFAAELYFGRGLSDTGLDRLNEEQRRLVVQQLVAPLHVTMLDGKPRRGILAANSWSPKRPPDDIVEAFVEPWCERMEKRQEQSLGTIAVAYADPNSAAFERDPKLRDKLFQMRALLLESPARHNVDLRDVVDRSYARELFSTTGGGQLKAPPTSSPQPVTPAQMELVPSSIEPPAGPSGGAPFEAYLTSTSNVGSGAGGLVVGVAAVALLLGYRRLTRRR
ncbi:MAG: hypothetical protein KC501_39855 [Myxococcales bacterium]|nr:hypothetical protein [Myxococcales bacterium]